MAFTCAVQILQVCERQGAWTFLQAACKGWLMRRAGSRTGRRTWSRGGCLLGRCLPGPPEAAQRLQLPLHGTHSTSCNACHNEGECMALSAACHAMDARRAAGAWRILQHDMQAMHVLPLEVVLQGLKSSKAGAGRHVCVTAEHQGAVKSLREMCELHARLQTQHIRDAGGIGYLLCVFVLL